MITEQEYQAAWARVREYEDWVRASSVAAKQTATKENQRILFVALEDPTLDGVDIDGNYYFRTSHKILGVTDSSTDWPDVNEWDAFVVRIKELFPHEENWARAGQFDSAAEKTL